MRYSDSTQLNSANYVPLHPACFLSRNAIAHPERRAVIDGSKVCTWREVDERCRKLAVSLQSLLPEESSTIGIICHNTLPMYEAHFAVPMAGAVLLTINTRLDAGTISFILRHSKCELLLMDSEFAELVSEALADWSQDEKPIVIDILDDCAKEKSRLGDLEYEALIQSADASKFQFYPQDELKPICINYTSGTTGNPKGAIYHCRGAYLSALGNAMTFEMNSQSTILWTLPLFHCNGWSQAWAIAAVGGTSVCLRGIDPKEVLSAIGAHDVTHISAAPVVLNMLADEAERQAFSSCRTVNIATGGSPPPSSIISRLESLGFRITHLYGLTETFGPSLVCERQLEWNQLDAQELSKKLSRQGVPIITDFEIVVLEPETLEPIPWDGATVGEIMIRSNGLMLGYLDNPEATEEAFEGGWFHTGDLAVTDPDGFIKVTDRSKDVIISGGENISSVELEEVLYSHPDISEVAVVAMPDSKWGETPCAFIAIAEGRNPPATEALIEWCRENLASFKVPRRYVFGPLPKTGTGKIQKFLLRERAKSLAASGSVVGSIN